MHNLDLDFREIQCRFAVSILLFFLILFFLGGIYLYRDVKRRITTIEKEAHILLNSDILPEGLVRKGNSTIALISINGKHYFVKEKDTLKLNGIEIYVNITDSTFSVRTSRFKRSGKW